MVLYPKNVFGDHTFFILYSVWRRNNANFLESQDITADFLEPENVMGVFRERINVCTFSDNL